MITHIPPAALPLILVAALILFRSLLTPLLITLAWTFALVARSPAGARCFQAMLRDRFSRGRGRLVGDHFEGMGLS